MAELLDPVILRTRRLMSQVVALAGVNVVVAAVTLVRVLTR